jgi:hypothetical protein
MKQAVACCVTGKTMSVGWLAVERSEPPDGNPANLLGSQR